MAEERAVREVKAVNTRDWSHADYARRYGITKRQASKIRALPQDEQRAAREKAINLDYNGLTLHKGPGLPGHPVENQRTRAGMGKTEYDRFRGKVRQRKRRGRGGHANKD